MREYIGSHILRWMIRHRLLRPKEMMLIRGRATDGAGRVFWLNETWSTNDPWRLDKEPWRSDRRGGYIRLPPGY